MKSPGPASAVNCRCSPQRLALHNEDDAFQMPMVMRAGLGVRPDRHRARPQFLCAHPREIDRGLAIHPGGGGHIGIELVAGNDADTVMLPALGMIVIMPVTGMGVIVGTCHRPAFHQI